MSESSVEADHEALNGKENSVADVSAGKPRELRKKFVLEDASDLDVVETVCREWVAIAHRYMTNKYTRNSERQGWMRAGSAPLSILVQAKRVEELIEKNKELESRIKALEDKSKLEAKQ